MAITWTVTHSERLILAIGRVDVTSADILFCADALARAGVNAYRKLFDLTRLVRTPTQDELRMVGERMSARAVGHNFGPVAVVVTSSAIAVAAQSFLDWAAADRPIRMFHNLHLGREWLDEVAPPAQIPLVET